MNLFDFHSVLLFQGFELPIELVLKTHLVFGHLKNVFSIVLISILMIINVTTSIDVQEERKQAESLPPYPNYYLSSDCTCSSEP